MGLLPPGFRPCGRLTPPHLVCASRAQGCLPLLPGATLYLRCPRLSLFQSHPFSGAAGASYCPCFGHGHGRECEHLTMGRNVNSLALPPCAVADLNRGPEGAVRATLHLRVAGWWTSGLARLLAAQRSVLLQVWGGQRGALLQVVRCLRCRVVSV